MSGMGQGKDQARMVAGQNAHAVHSSTPVVATDRGPVASGIDTVRPERRDAEGTPRRRSHRMSYQGYEYTPSLLATAGDATGTGTRSEASNSSAPSLAAPKPRPSGWTVKEADRAWSWLGHTRPPLVVTVVGAEGGVGTTTVATLIGETVAAGSPGPTMLLDHCGSLWGSLSRRLLGQRAGIPAARAHALLAQGIPQLRAFRQAPATSAGAAVVVDGAVSTPLRVLLPLVWTACGTAVIDGGPLLPPTRRTVQPRLLLCGRADIVGAEATCSALEYLRRSGMVHPAVVLCSPRPIDARQARAARKLMTARGIAPAAHLPFDARLAAPKPLRLDRVGKTTAGACLQLVMAIAQGGEVSSHVD